MIPEDMRAKPCGLSLAEIEKRLTPEQRKAARDIWRAIKKSQLPIRSYLDMLELFQEMVIDSVREMFEEAGADFEYKPAESLAKSVTQRYGAIAWLEAKARHEPLERMRAKRSKS